MATIILPGAGIFSKNPAADPIAVKTTAAGLTKQAIMVGTWESGAINYKNDEIVSIKLKGTDLISTDLIDEKITMQVLYDTVYKDSSSSFHDYQIIYNTKAKSFGINE